jgi:WD40 repeat protein
VDFIKCLLSVRVGQHNLIISGGAEGDINIWEPPSTKLHTIRGNSGAVQDLILDPLSDPANPVIFVATSGREILYFSISSVEQLNFRGSALSEPIIAHETSVYKLAFDFDGDLWTASADKTAKHLVREGGWKVDTTLEHPDFVRDIAVHERSGWVVTACRDEEVRVWNRGTGDLYHTFAGHFEEVTGLCLIDDLVVSVSIDATMRQWSLKPADLAVAKEEAAKPKSGQEAEMVKANPETALTEEEERELRELMEHEEQELQELMAEDLQ